VSAQARNGSALVSWAAAAANGSPVREYRVTASPGGATATTTGATSLVVPGLANGTAYMFTVTATNWAGTGPASPLSNVAIPSPLTETELYVTKVYADLFNRPPDPAGLRYWSTALNRRTPYGAVANSITYSREFRGGLITESYLRYLGRPPEPAGLEGWLGEMDRGLHIERMQSGFIASPEFFAQAGGSNRQWVANLYHTVLGRAAAVSEIDAWERRILGGASRQGVALGFLYSTEHLTEVVNGYYLDLLRRPIDPAGARGWVLAIQAGARDEEIIAGIVSSLEYRANV
jgi:hypothetical protein